MKRIIQVLFIILISLNLSQAAGDFVAVVIKAKGKVTITRPGENRSWKGEKGMVLRSGDRIETGIASFCAIKFLDDKSLLRIKEKSECVVEGKKEQGRIDKNIFVEVGSFFASIFKQRGQFLITTPTSVASVKGTKFWTIQERNGPTTYIGIEGLIDISNKGGRILLRAGQTGIVKDNQTPPVARLTNPDEVPMEEEGDEGRQFIEIEFRDADGKRKVMKIEVWKK